MANVSAPRDATVMSQEMGTIWGDVVTILVGREPEQIPFVVHAQNLAAVSRRFKDMINDGNRKRRIELRNVSPKLFDRFCEYCYSGLLEGVVPPNVPNFTLDLDSVAEVRIKLRFVELVDCWLMGHELWAPSFQNEALRTWKIKFAAEKIGYEKLDVKLAWEQKNKHPKLRAFLIDAYAYGNPTELWIAPFKKSESLPNSFLQQLMGARELKPRKGNKYVGVLSGKLDPFMLSQASMHQTAVQIEDGDDDYDANHNVKHSTESAQQNAVSQSNAGNPASTRDFAGCPQEAGVRKSRIKSGEPAFSGADTNASLFHD